MPRALKRELTLPQFVLKKRVYLPQEILNCWQVSLIAGIVALASGTFVLLSSMFLLEPFKTFSIIISVSLFFAGSFLVYTSFEVRKLFIYLTVN